MMMATVLVALMAFAVQSCGSDDKDDLSSSFYELVSTITIQQRGELTDKDIEEFKNQFNKSEKGEYMTDQMAATRTDQIVQIYNALLQELGKRTTSSTTVFTVTIVTTNLKTKNVVCKWDLVWDKGSVSSKKY